MKKIFFILLLILVVACTTVNQPSKQVYGVMMKNAFERVFSEAQFDSICHADSLPTDLKKWQKLDIRDDETRVGSYEYLFIKRLGQNEQIYRLEDYGNGNYKITKRETK